MSGRAVVGMFIFVFYGILGTWLWMKVAGD